MEDNNILDIIKKRWSPFSFSPKPVEEYKLKAILEAARYAPSSVNEQPWMFIFTTRETPEKFNDFIAFLNETNQIWAKSAYALIDGKELYGELLKRHSDRKSRKEISEYVFKDALNNPAFKNN